MSETGKNERELEGLYARLGDLAERAARGELGVSAFLSPRELHYASIFARSRKIRFFAFGGYEDAERRKIYILPEYLEDVQDAQGLENCGFESEIASLHIKGSGFKRLTHRDFMGSVLGLGLQRSVVGDIVTQNDEEAVVFCDCVIADFLCDSLTRVGNDRVCVERYALPKAFAAEKRSTPVSHTVASPRLDAVVAALCSVSREKAKELVCKELVELDYECESRFDREVRGGSIISVRGYGKFRVTAVEDKTRKGRYRLNGEKYL